MKQAVPEIVKGETGFQVQMVVRATAPWFSTITQKEFLEGRKQKIPGKEQT